MDDITYYIILVNLSQCYVTFANGVTASQGCQSPPGFGQPVPNKVASCCSGAFVALGP